MLGRRGDYAIRALLELALQPGGWRSVADLAEAQDLPAPMLEQLLLQLRRAGLECSVADANAGRSNLQYNVRSVGQRPILEET